MAPEAERQWWYQYYFATERGRAGYERYRREFARLIWRTASPQWDFDDATFERSAASLENPDHVAIVIHNYRWRIGLGDGEPQYDTLERRLAEAPVITVPTITLEGDANGAPHPDPAPTRGSSRARTRTGPSPAASATTCLRRRLRRSPGRSSTSTPSKRLTCRGAAPAAPVTCEWLYYLRSDLNAARSSSQKIWGCSQAAKWPPRSTRL